MDIVALFLGADKKDECVVCEEPSRWLTIELNSCNGTEERRGIRIVVMDEDSRGTRSTYSEKSVAVLHDALPAFALEFSAMLIIPMSTVTQTTSAFT